MRTMLRIAYRNVRLNWRHSLAAILSITASFFSLVLFEGYMQDIGEVYYDGYRNRGMYGDFIIQNKDLQTPAAKAEPDQFFLSEQQQAKIDNFLNEHKDQLFAKVRFLDLQGMITNGRSSTIFVGHGYDLNEAAKIRRHWEWNTLYGLPTHLAKTQHPAVLGQTLGAILGCEPVKREQVMAKNGGYIPKERPINCYRNELQLSLLTSEGQLNAMDFNVSGLVDAGYHEIDGRFVGMSLPDAQTLLHTKKISFYTVELNDIKQTTKFKSDFESSLGKEEPGLQIIKWQDHEAGELYKKSLDLLSIFRNFVVVVILSVSVLSVMNTMVKIIKERTREVGTLQSLGFHKDRVRLIFIFEAMFLSLIGSGAGIIISLVVSILMNQMGILYRAGLLSEPVPFRIQINLVEYLGVVILLMLVTGITANLSIRSTLRKKIVDCLTYS